MDRLQLLEQRLQVMSSEISAVLGEMQNVISTLAKSNAMALSILEARISGLENREIVPSPTPEVPPVAWDGGRPMRIQEAIESGRPFRRRSRVSPFRTVESMQLPVNTIRNYSGDWAYSIIPLSIPDILATDWEIEEEITLVQISKSDLTDLISENNGSGFVDLLWKKLLSHKGLLLILILVLTGCGTYDRANGDCYAKGEHCTPGKRPGSDTDSDRPAGSQGIQSGAGPAGIPGSTGADGPQGATGARGYTGDKGDQGDTGATGGTGYSIVFQIESILQGDSICPAGGSRIRMAQDTDYSGAWNITDGSQQVSSVCSAQSPTPSAFTPVAVIDPCGDSPGIQDEVILQMSNGQLLASFSDNASGLNTRFSLLTPGSYQTTDGSHCNFTVHPDYSVTW